MLQHPDNPDEELRAEGDDLLARATGALRDGSIPMLPLDVAAKAAELGRAASQPQPSPMQIQKQGSGGSPGALPSRGVFTMRAIWKLAAAAVIAVVMGGVLFTSIGRHTNV